MSKKPPVFGEKYHKETGELYADIGRIAVNAEHLNDAMNYTCSVLLHKKGLPTEYVATVLAGANLESMRRIWISLMKLFYRVDTGANEIIEQLSHRIDNITQRRNDTIHRVWFIGQGDEDTVSFAIAQSEKIGRDIRPKGRGGVRVSSRDTRDFKEIIREMQLLQNLVNTVTVCIASGQDIKGRFFFEDGELKPGPPRIKK